MKVRRKLKTLFTHPRRVIWKYFCPFWCKLFNIPPPPYGEDYDHHWGYTSFNGKTVLDLGADYGSTAHFFLSRGAQRVVAVEGDSTWALKLKNRYGKDSRVVCIERWIGSAEDLVDLLASYPVDVAKVDIVGAERFLLDVPPKLLRSVDEWLIQSNSFESASALMNLFSSIGFFTVVCFVVDSHVIFYCVKSAYHEDA